MFKPGEGGRPKGVKNKSSRKADEAFELVFDALQENDTTSLQAWAKDNLTEFYKLFAKKLTTTSDNKNHNVSETVSQEQARTMAEAFIESSRNRVGEGESDRLHGGISSGLPGEQAASQDRGGAGAGGVWEDPAVDDLRSPEAREVDADLGTLSSVVPGEKP